LGFVGYAILKTNLGWLKIGGIRTEDNDDKLAISAKDVCGWFENNGENGALQRYVASELETCRSKDR
jgi:hypothetical protein